MKYLLHIAAFTLFVLIGLACAGFMAPLVVLRVLGTMICALVACYVVAAAFGERVKSVPTVSLSQPLQPPTRWTVTAVASEDLPAGAVCTVDLAGRTVEKAAS